MKRYLPSLYRNVSVGCRWVFGWHLPLIYLTAASWRYDTQNERKLLIDLGRSRPGPAKRQIHLVMVTLLEDQEV